jgi:hypothetical protein
MPSIGMSSEASVDDCISEAPDLRVDSSDSSCSAVLSKSLTGISAVQVNWTVCCCKMISDLIKDNP